MSEILHTLVAGVAATAAMTVFMWMVHSTGVANADMVRAIGSLYTRSYENALWPGLFIHFSAGVMFAFFYIALWSLIPHTTFGVFVALGVVVGFFHGLTMSFVLIALVSDRHPVARFRAAGFEVALAHLAGHVVYGGVLGLVVGALEVRYSILPTLG
ncbi:MAG: hypothetical protein HY423_04860 [Candidatus Lambdaproteobacteria bacterium]|nr:hypothetical protein [Candidatus Lambdaproteobacteria bacterium]